MQGRYLAIFKLLGVTGLPPGSETLEFLQLPEIQATVKLTTNCEPFCFHIDRSRATAAQLMQGLFGARPQGTPQERLNAEIERFRNSRKERFGTGFFLIFEGTGEISSPDFKTRRDMDDFGVSFDAFSKVEFRERFAPAVHAVLAAIGLTLPEHADRRLEKVGDVCYLVEDETSRVVYSFTAEGGNAILSIASPLSEDAIGAARGRVPRLLKDKALPKVSSLLTESLETETDHLRAFIAAWAALEIFVNATFKSYYEGRWFEALAAAAPEPAKPYFDRLRQVMRDKHRLADKFLVIASILDPSAAEADAEEFDRLKSTRDNLFHAQDIDVRRLPSEQVQRLLNKYLELHTK